MDHLQLWAIFNTCFAHQPKNHHDKEALNLCITLGTRHFSITLILPIHTQRIAFHILCLDDFFHQSFIILIVVIFHFFWFILLIICGLLKYIEWDFFLNSSFSKFIIDVWKCYCVLHADFVMYNFTSWFINLNFCFNGIFISCTTHHLQTWTFSLPSFQWWFLLFFSPS